MIRILQISDIHFKRLPDAKDEYTQLKERLYEKVEEIVKDSKIDCILICGDVAFSGSPDEYEQKAKAFVNKLLELTQCQAAQVYMVPGNHDKNRDAGYPYTRTLLRESMLKEEMGYVNFFSLYMDENDVYAKWLIPFEAYTAFANEYRCVSDCVVNTKAGKKKEYGDKFYWEDELKVGPYSLRLHGINSCYVSDWDDDKHDQILPKELYYTTNNKNVVNVSVMHHPLEFVKDAPNVEEEIDRLYQIQFYGHIHKQTIVNKAALKIYSGAIMPPKSERNGEDAYEPVFNLIEFNEGEEVIMVTVKPYRWERTSKDDGVFIALKEEGPYEMAVDSASAKTVEQGKVLKMPKGVNQRSVEVDFLQSGRTDKIISQMYEGFEFSDDAVADTSTFLDKVREDDRYIDLYNYIHE